MDGKIPGKTGFGDGLQPTGHAKPLKRLTAPGQFPKRPNKELNQPNREPDPVQQGRTTDRVKSATRIQIMRICPTRGIRVSSFIAGLLLRDRTPIPLAGNALWSSQERRNRRRYPVIAFDVPQERERCVEHTGEFLAEHAVANEPAATAPGSLTPALVSAQMRSDDSAGFGARPNQLPVPNRVGRASSV